MDVVCGGLKLTLPSNDMFASITAGTVSSGRELLTGTIAVDAKDGQVVLLEEQASKKVVLQGEIDISNGQEVYIALPPVIFSEALQIKFATLKGVGSCTVNLTGERIESGKVL